MIPASRPTVSLSSVGQASCQRVDRLVDGVADRLPDGRELLIDVVEGLVDVEHRVHDRSDSAQSAQKIISGPIAPSAACLL